MKTVVKYIERIILGTLVVLLFSNSTFAYSIDYHFCQDELKSVAFFGTKASCSKMVESNQGSCCDKSTKGSNGESISSESCCSHDQLENATVLQKKIDSKSTITPLTIAVQPNDHSLDLIDGFDEQLDSFKITHPPFLHQKNKPSSLQVFLI